MKTSQDVIEPGLYVSDCCSYELLLVENDCYTRCPGCEGLCEWELVENVLLWTETQG